MNIQPLSTSPISRALVTALLLSGGAASVQGAVTYTTSFDGTFDETLTPPYIGTGTLMLDTAVPSDGSYDWLDLAAAPGFSLTIAFGATEFTEADLVTPAGEVNFEIHEGNFYFSNDNEFGSGLFGGAADFVGEDTFLTTEPVFPGSGPLAPRYFGEGEFEQFEGTYGIEQASAIPEPSNGTIMLGLFLTGALIRRRK